MLGFLSVTAMVGSVNIVTYVPMLLHAWVTCGMIALDSQGVPSAIKMIVNFPLTKWLMLKGASNKQQLTDLKSDMEVYIGFYLIIAWFFGMSHFVAIMLYWQIMRLHYMLSYNCQHAFSRFDQKLQSAVFSRAYCPSILNRAYNVVKGMMAQMGALPTRD